MIWIKTTQDIHMDSGECFLYITHISISTSSTVQSLLFYILMHVLVPKPNKTGNFLNLAKYFWRQNVKLVIS